MANTFLTPSVIAREALLVLSNELVGANLVHRDNEAEFAGAKVGNTITVRGPATFTANEFTTTTSVQDATESNVSLVLEKHFDVTVAVTAKELTLDISDFSSQIILPAITPIAEAVDSYLYSKYTEVYAWSGTAGDPPDALADLADVDRVLNENKVPARMRNAVLNPAGKADMMGIPAVHQANMRGDEGTALRDASMGRVMNMDWWMAQGVKAHTAGTASGIATPLVNGAGTAGDATINIDGGAGTETLLVGDLISIAGEGQHVVTANNTAAGGAFTAVAISPALRVDVADNAAVTIVGDHTANLAFHRNAITLAVVPLAIPMGAANAEYVNFNGMGIRVVSDYNSSTKTDTISFDILCGAKVQDPRLAARILG